MALTISVSEIVETSSNRLLKKHESWGRVLLGDVATVLNGFAFNSSEFSNASGMPLIRIRDVGKDSSETYYQGEHDPRYIVEPGDLLVGMDGDFNCARWRGPRGILNQRVCKITLKSDIYLPKFLDYTLPGYLKAINDVTSSVTVKHLSSKSIEEIPLPLPPKEVQQRLVAEIEKQFSRLDEAVANLKRVKANLKRYKASVLKAAVEGKLTEDWRKQYPNVESASKLLERILVERRARWNGRGKYKEPAKPDMNNLPSLPEKWTWASVDQLTSHITSGSRDWTRYYGRGSGTFILAQNVRLMRLDLSERQAVDPPKNDAETARTRVSIGDILVTIVGAKTGEVCRIPKELVDHFVCQSVALLRPLMPASAKFMELYLASPENGQAQWRQYIYGQGRPHLSFEQLKMTAIALPSLAEQHEIVAEVERRLSVIEELESAIEANLTRADRLRQSILQQAFSGRLLSEKGYAGSSDLPMPLLAAESVSPYGVRS